MISLGLLVILVAVVAVVVVLLRRPAPHPELELHLSDWVAAGLIDEQTSAAIGRFEAEHVTVGAPVAATVGAPSSAPISAPVSAPVSTSMAAPAPAVGPAPAVHPAVAPAGARPAFAGVVEALGYLGGVLATTGVVLLVAHYWTDLGAGGQLAISGLTAAALIAGGRAVPEASGAAMARLRSFLWTLGTAAVGVFAAVLADELGAPSPGSRVTAITAGAVALTSGLMWWGRFRPVQQLITLVAAVVAVGASFALLINQVGAGTAVWLAGAALVVLSWRNVTATPVIDTAVGSISMGVGSVMVVADGNARLLVVAATGLILVALALAPRLFRNTPSVVVLAVVGSVVLLQSAPPTIGFFAQDAGVATGLVVWLAGAAVLALGIRRLTRVPLVLEVLGGLVMLGGAAVTAAGSPGFATIFGLATALALLGVSMLPSRVALAPVGAVGLLVNVPWAISWFFPGEGRVPLLISVSGVLIIAVAVLMARLGHRFGTELGRHPLPRG